MHARRLFRGPLVWLLLALIVVLVALDVFSSDSQFKGTDLSTVQTQISTGNVDNATIFDTKQSIQISTKNGQKLESSYVQNQAVQLANALQDKSVKYQVKVDHGNPLP